MTVTAACCVAARRNPHQREHLGGFCRSPTHGGSFTWTLVAARLHPLALLRNPLLELNLPSGRRGNALQCSETPPATLHDASMPKNPYVIHSMYTVRTQNVHRMYTVRTQ